MSPATSAASAPPLRSLRRRLSATVLVVSLVWGVALALAVTYTVRQAVEELLDNALQESAEILYGLIRNHVDDIPVTAGHALPAPPHDEHLVWQVVSARGEVRWRSHRAPQEALVLPLREGFANARGGWRVYGMGLGTHGDMLYVGQVAHVRQAMLWRAAGAAAAVTLGVGVLSAWWLRRRMNHELRPLTQLSAAVTRYDPLHTPHHPAQAAVSLPSTVQELEPMRQAIEELGARLAHRVASERAFAAHAAHALRTPLAGMMAQLAVAQVKSSPEALPHLQRMGTALDRLRSVVTALLTLFRAEQVEPRRARIVLSELAAHLPFDNLRIEVTHDGDMWGDADLLLAALLNLLDNAQRHGATAVQLILSPGATPRADWTLDIVDNGQGLSPQACAALQANLDAQHYAQLGGLGLMLSDLIARAHGGRLQLCHEDKGLRVNMRFSRQQDLSDWS